MSTLFGNFFQNFRRAKGRINARFVFHAAKCIIALSTDKSRPSKQLLKALPKPKNQKYTSQNKNRYVYIVTT